jgi:hypothetical protein
MKHFACFALALSLIALFACTDDEPYYGGDNPHYTDRSQVYGDWEVYYKAQGYQGFPGGGPIEIWRLAENSKSLRYFLSGTNDNSYRFFMMTDTFSWELVNGNRIRFSESRLKSIADFIETEYLPIRYGAESSDKCVSDGFDEVCVWTLSNLDSLFSFLMLDSILPNRHECLIVKDKAHGNPPPSSELTIDCNPSIPIQLEFGESNLDPFLYLDNLKDYTAYIHGLSFTQAPNKIDTISTTEMIQTLTSKETAP